MSASNVARSLLNSCSVDVVTDVSILLASVVGTLAPQALAASFPSTLAQGLLPCNKGGRPGGEVSVERLLMVLRGLEPFSVLSPLCSFLNLAL